MLNPLSQSLFPDTCPFMSCNLGCSHLPLCSVIPSGKINMMEKRLFFSPDFILPFTPLPFSLSVVMTQSPWKQGSPDSLVCVLLVSPVSHFCFLGNSILICHSSSAWFISEGHGLLINNIMFT